MIVIMSGLSSIPMPLGQGPLKPLAAELILKGVLRAGRAICDLFDH